MVAERARLIVGAEKINGFAVTCSFGVASVPIHATTPEEWLKKADSALYDAKQLGRNLVRISGEPPPQPNEPRKPARKQPIAGDISDDQKERLRLDILRHGYATCPFDQTPMKKTDISSSNSIGDDFFVRCPACGYQAELIGPQRE